MVFSFRIVYGFSVVIDPGHGGRDSGAVRGSTKESDIVLNLSHLLANELKKYPDLKVTLTRTSNLLIPLVDRVSLANDHQADLFLSLHANSSSSANISGMELYFNAQTRGPVLMKNKANDKNLNSIVDKIRSDLIFFGKTNASLDFSKSMQNKVTDTRSVIKQAPFYVIENTEMPSVLIEVGFISNLREARKLVTAEYQSELVQTLTRAILDYKEKSDKQATYR